MASLRRQSGFRFGFGESAKHGLGVPVPVLAGEHGESFFADATEVGAETEFTLYTQGTWLFGVWVGDRLPDLGAQTRELYKKLLGLIQRRRLQVARIWNFVPEINEDAEEGLENYRVFCRGRAQAYESAGCGVLPAASAVGGVAGRLAVYFAACPSAPRRYENPEQVPAYEYPPEYGPRSPSFSRAMQVDTAEGRVTFVSGTASIKGHASVMPGCLQGQINCTLDNLRLISAACGLGENLAAGRARERHFKVYLRHAEELAVVRARLESGLLRDGDQVCWLRSDICRRELRLELEATVVE